MKKSWILELCIGLSLALSGCNLKVSDKNNGSAAASGSGPAPAAAVGTAAQGAARVPSVDDVKIEFQSPLQESLESGAAPEEALAFKLAAKGCVKFSGPVQILSQISVSRLVRPADSALLNELGTTAKAFTDSVDWSLAEAVTLGQFAVTGDLAAAQHFFTRGSGAGTVGSDLGPEEIIYRVRYGLIERTFHLLAKKDLVVSGAQALPLNFASLNLGGFLLLQDSVLTMPDSSVVLEADSLFAGGSSQIRNGVGAGSRFSGDLRVRAGLAQGSLVVNLPGAAGEAPTAPPAVTERPARGADAHIECTAEQKAADAPCTFVPQQPGAQGFQGQRGANGNAGLIGGHVGLVVDKVKNFTYRINVEGGAGGQPGPGGAGGPGAEGGRASYVWLQNLPTRYYDGGLSGTSWPGNTSTVICINPIYNANCGAGGGRFCMRLSGAADGGKAADGGQGPQGPPGIVPGAPGASGLVCIERDGQRSCESASLSGKLN
jgi:hypothetical protein